ncbi:MAG: hypothetical protein ABIQ95_13440 [Bdellovibrionia bacterium]
MKKLLKEFKGGFRIPAILLVGLVFSEMTLSVSSATQDALPDFHNRKGSHSWTQGTTDEIGPLKIPSNPNLALPRRRNFKSIFLYGLKYTGYINNIMNSCQNYDTTIPGTELMPLLRNFSEISNYLDQARSVQK